MAFLIFWAVRFCIWQDSGNPFWRSGNTYGGCAGFIREIDILRITYVLRRAGCIKDNRSTVFRLVGRFVAGSTPASISRSGIVRCVEFDSHLVDFRHDFVVQPLTELYQQRGNEGRFALKSWESNKVLVIRILGNLLQQFPVGITVLLLDHKGSKCHAKRLGGHARFTREQICVFILNGISGNGAAFFTQRFSRFIFNPTG